MIARVAPVLVLLVAAACGSDHKVDPQPQPEPRPRRIIEPPVAGTVRPLPPYVIRAEGVGPYKLGERSDQTLEQLPSAPRVASFEIANVVHRWVIRAEDDTVLIGAPPESTATATFVAVINAEVARTETGVHVGSTRDDIVKALGPVVEEPDRVRDPRLLVLGQLPNLRVVFDGDRAAALVLLAEPVRAKAAEIASACTRPASTDKLFGACTGASASGELVGIEGDDIAVREAVGDHPPVAVHIPGLQFAAPIRSSDGHDDLVAIARTDDPAQRTWTASAYRIEAGHLVRVIDPQVIYQLSAGSARGIGAELDHVELYVELTSHIDGLEVGGLLTTKIATKEGAKIRDVVTLATVNVARRHGKSVGSGSDPAPDAQAPDAAAPDR